MGVKQSQDGQGTPRNIFSLIAIVCNKSEGELLQQLLHRGISGVGHSPSLFIILLLIECP